MNSRLVNYYRIEEAISYLSDNFREQPDLDVIAGKVHMSPFHFQRLFTDWVGISPKKFVQHLTLDYLREKIKETSNMMEAAEIAGLSSQSRVHDLFLTVEGVSPQQYKSAGKGMEIFYGYHASPFGLCFIAVTEKGICGLQFVDEERARNEFELFSQRWSLARLVHKPEFTQLYIKKIFPDKGPREDLQLLVKGSDFQVKVWEALVQIPFGSVVSFEQIAKAIGQPHAVRAVGGAVKTNSIQYLIPCHRVLTKQGTVGNFHLGKVRKQAMIGWEMARVLQEKELTNFTGTTPPVSKNRIDGLHS